MQVEDIQVLSCQTCRRSNKVTGRVAFTVTGKMGQSRDMVISCDTPVSRRIPADAVLIGDAIRQLRRLPEVRTGLTRLSFAPGLSPLSTSRAA